MEMKKILDNSGVSAAEFAALCGVSKNMVYKWIKGAKPHTLREAKIAKLLSALTRAVEAGDLPLAGAGPTRAMQIQAALIANIKKVV